MIFYRALSELDCLRHFLTRLCIRTQYTKFSHFRASPATRRTHQLPSAHKLQHAARRHFLSKPLPCFSRMSLPLQAPPLPVSCPITVFPYSSKFFLAWSLCWSVLSSRTETMSFLKVSNLGSWAPFPLKVECGAVSPLFSAFSVTCPQLYIDHIKWKIPEAISKLLLLLVFFL